MDLLQHMETFVRIADAGSISRAAKGLRLSVAMTSRHLRALEDDLGVELVRRSTRKLALTDAGIEFLARSRALLAGADEARRAVRPGPGVAGRLVMSLPVSFSLARLGPVFPLLLAEHPRLELDLRFEDRFVDLLGDGVDLAIRAGAVPPDSPNVVARKLAIIDRVLCATPSFLARHRVASVDALAQVPCVVQGSNTRWTFDSGPGKAADPSVPSPRVIDVRGRFHTNSIIALREAILGSVGVGRIPLWIADEDLQKRRLVQVLPELTLRPLDVFGMFHTSSRGSAAIHAALDFLARELPRRTKMRRVEAPRARR
jgi:DNA-binding transcriptional LysR family regulator